MSSFLPPPPPPLLDIGTRVFPSFLKKKSEKTGAGLQRPLEIWLFSRVPVWGDWGGGGSAK